MGLEEQCVLYDKKKKQCTALDDTFCRDSYDCAFYKSRALYKKAKRSKLDMTLYPLTHEYRERYKEK